MGRLHEAADHMMIVMAVRKSDRLNTVFIDPSYKRDFNAMTGFQYPLH
jgi:hypothetical protein